VYLKDYHDLSEARLSIGTFITEVYHAKRLHQSLGYRTPDEVFTQWHLQNPLTPVQLLH
jgi:transposase InsO family protein